MIKLTKIVLINWMYFQHAILPIEGNAAIVGVNGTGKSTIIDAIQMLLLGNKASKFNANANAEKRSLESYVRGAVNTEEKEYLRPGDVITYLALEIDLNGESHIFGMNINYRYERANLSDPKYFYINGVKICEDMFIKDKYPKSYDVIAKEYKLQHFATLYSYQTKLKDVLGLKDSKKYFQILSRAVGIKNITNCNDFMNEFVLDKNPIDVEAIKNNILEMEKVNATIECEKKKLDRLKEIVDLGITIQESEECLIKTKVQHDLAEIINCELKVAKLEEEKDNLIKQVNAQEKIITTLNDECELLKDHKRELIKSLDSISPDLQFKREELEKINKQYANVHTTLNTFISMCKNELPNLSVLSKYKQPSFENLYVYLSNGDYSSAITLNLFNEFRDAADSLKTENEHAAVRLESEIKDVRDSLVGLDNIIRDLQNNKFTYKPIIEEFRKYIKTNLENKYKEKIEVKFLCEYLEVSDKTWQRAIEGYLNTQRFYIVVPNKYYKEALKLYHAKKDFYATRIINGTKLPDLDIKENTLGSFIESSNPIALNYARMILNRVHCANDIYNLENYDIAVTKDCMHYQNYSVGRLDLRACDMQYIGQNAIKTQLELRQKEIAELSQYATELRNKYQKYNQNVNILNIEIKFARTILEKNTYIDSIDEDSKIFDRIEGLTKEIKFYESKPMYIEISNKISETDEKIKKASNQLKEMNDSLVNLQSNIKANESSISDINIEIAEMNTKLSSYSDGLIETQRIGLTSKKISKSFIDLLDKEIRITETDIIKKKSSLENLMKNARDDFSINCQPKYESLQKFIEEKNKINQSMFKYSSKLIDFKKNNRKLFFSQFLSKLYKAIEKAKVDIDNLNHSLSIFDFGNDCYKIKMGITEHPDFKVIYDYAKKYNANDSDRGIFIDRDSEDRERNKIQDILNEYMFSPDPMLNSMIVDYRKYLLFDVEVHTPNGVKSLNKVMRSQSGGEVQVPFYILSGVAFQQTLDYRRNKDVLGIVLYDEAFDKMDTQRIQSMLQFYRDKLNLQLILATPGKLDSLVDNIETILAVIRDGENAIVSDVSHEI